MASFKFYSIILNCKHLFYLEREHSKNMDKRKQIVEQCQIERIFAAMMGAQKVFQRFSPANSLNYVWWRTNTVYRPTHIIIPHGRDVREEEVHLPARQIKDLTKIQ